MSTQNTSQASTRRTALVTGATGYLGFRLVHRLAGEGWKVDFIARPSSDAARTQALSKVATRHDCDGGKNSARELGDALSFARPDVVFHLATRYLASHGSEQIEELIRSNVTFVTQLC